MGNKELKDFEAFGRGMLSPGFKQTRKKPVFVFHHPFAE